MTIDGLNALTALTENDELPVWDAEASGEEPTKKITASNAAASMKSLAGLPNTTEMGSAITSSQKGTAIGALITNRNQYFDYHYAMKFGGIVILSFLVMTGAPNNTTLCTLDSSIKPAVGDYIAPLFYGNGQMNTQASVWIEHGNTTLVKYYGATATAGAYVTLIYGIE